MQPIYVPKTPHEKALQRALIQYRKPENYDLVHEALTKAGRSDLIGYGPKCLIRPIRPHGTKTGRHNGGKGSAARSNGAPSGRGTISNSRTPREASGTKRGSNAHGRNRAGQGREANRGGHRG